MSRANNTRYDLSDRLIHFVRPLKIDEPDAPEFPEHMGWGNMAEDVAFSPFFLLRCILRQGRIWASWSVRGKRRTIYGPRPAVCFTEMPIPAFLQSGRARAARGQKMSPYGLVVPKDQLFKLGARPVIYALAGAGDAEEGRHGERRFPPRMLPLREQFRFVTFDPSHSRGVDWTHEREWRWPGSARKRDRAGMPPSSWEEVPGLDLYPELSRLGAIVRSPDQAKRLVHDILRLVDQGRASPATFEFVLHIDGLPNAKDLWRPADVEAVLRTHTVDLAPLLEPPTHAKAMARNFGELVRSVAASRLREPKGERGGCWLWLYDNRHPLTRSLLATGRLSVSRDGRYLADLPEFGRDGSLGERESLTKLLAQRTKDEFGVDSGYFSVLGKADPDETPFYCECSDEEGIFFNESWHEEDY